MTDAHFDDEVLSAVLDGEGTAEESAHTDSCATCGARLAALRDASLLVGAPVDPPAPAGREAAIAAALAAAPTNVVPLRRWRSLPQWLPAAAVVAVVVGSFALFASTSSTGDDDDAATGGDTSDLTATAEGGDEDASMMAAPAIPDLGAIEDADLEAAIDRVVARQANELADDATATTATAEESDSAADAPDAAAGTGASGVATCETEVRAGNASLGPLVFVATGTWEGEPATVLAFDVARDDGDVDRWAYVVATEGCGIRNQQTFAG